MSLLPIHFCREPNERLPSAAADNGSGLCTFISMKTKKLTEVLERIEAWPPEAQDELADFALELDAGLSDGEYQPTAEELAGIDRGLRAAAEGRFATPQQVEAGFRKIPRVNHTALCPKLSKRSPDRAKRNPGSLPRGDILPRIALRSIRATKCRSRTCECIPIPVPTTSLILLVSCPVRGASRGVTEVGQSESWPEGQPEGRCGARGHASQAWTRGALGNRPGPLRGSAFNGWTRQVKGGETCLDGELARACARKNGPRVEEVAAAGR